MAKVEIKIAKRNEHLAGQFITPPEEMVGAFNNMREVNDSVGLGNVDTGNDGVTYWTTATFTNLLPEQVESLRADLKGREGITFWVDEIKVE